MECMTIQPQSSTQPTLGRVLSPPPQSAAAPVTATPEPGYQSTEFWQTLLTNLLAVAVSAAEVLGVGIDSTAVQAVVPAVALIASAIATACYAHSRSRLKAAHAAAAAPQTR